LRSSLLAQFASCATIEKERWTTPRAGGGVNIVEKKVVTRLTMVGAAEPCPETVVGAREEGMADSFAKVKISD
jgi:hypothetical protein